MADDDIDRLAAAYAKLERIYRLPLLLTTVAIAGGGLFSMAGALLLDGRAGLGNALRFGAMTMLGLVGCYGAMTMYRVWRKQNAEIVGLYRQLKAMSAVIEEFRPVAAAIEDAHRQGCAAVIPPPDERDERPSGKLN
jgi:hypothetical protein